MTERRPGAAPLVITALTSFLASQTCLVLYLNDHLEGSTGVFAAVFISLTLVAAWILGALALRAAGRRGAVAFLLVAPWPILAVDVITFAFSASLAVYVITGVAAVFVVGLGLELMPARGRPPNRTVAP